MINISPVGSKMFPAGEMLIVIIMFNPFQDFPKSPKHELLSSRETLPN